jgi:competence ComEA-like helix-hairpin-helix protein
VVRPFHFDPNTASPEQLMRLGLSERTARSICHYREKGGQFRKPSDLKKIYTLKPADFDRLEPFIQIGQAEKKPEPVSETIAVVKEDKPEPQYHAEPEKRNYSTKKVRTDLKIDINRALEAEWRQLPGLGEKRAAQIVRFRSALGGFISVDQVSELYGLPDSIFLRIRPMLELTSGGIKSLNLNTATEEELKKHPYISFRQAKLILSYREQHGSFHAVDDLQKIAAFTDKKWLDKIKPYLSVE